MSMDEKDFGKLIASFLRGESPPASEEEPESDKEERPEKPRRDRKSLLESLMERADALKAAQTVHGVGPETGESARGGSGAGASEDRADSGYGGIIDREVHIFEPEETAFQTDESRVRLKEVVPSKDAAVGEEGSPSEGVGSVPGNGELALTDDFSSESEEISRFGAAGAPSRKGDAGESPANGSVSPPPRTAEPRALGRIVEAISKDLEDADVVLATGDGLSIASAGAGDADALASCVPDLLRTLDGLAGRASAGEFNLVFVEASEADVLLAPVNADLFLIVRADKSVSAGLLRWSVRRHLKLRQSDD